MKKNKPNTLSLCRCGSALGLENCCASHISGSRCAESPEQLMRSRFVAYATGNMDYVKSTWHSSTRPLDIAHDDSIQWLRLEVLSASKDYDKSGEGFVEFKAAFINTGTEETVHRLMHERSRFIIEDGYWFYVDGEQFDTEAGSTMKKPGRNEPCFCGSGKKYKKCCAKNNA